MMANCCTVMSQAEIATLKDTLCAQQKLLQQLYNELEAEREASATAASEALSVILRLQGEKAAVKMEAEQYKRLAEEKMGYAEESFAMIEDMITEKEMEVAELDYQVQTYRYQLMNMGFDVPAADDISFPEHLFQRHDSLAGETSLHHFKGKMAMLEREGSTSTDLDFISKHVEEQASQEINEFVSDSERKADVSTHEGISCFAGQIKELQQRVKDISGANIPGFMSESHSPSMSSRPSSVNVCSLSNSANLQPEMRLPSQLSISSSVGEVGQFKQPENSSKNSEAVHSPRPPTVHDVFEVPQVDQESTLYESSNKDGQMEVCQASDIHESQDQAHLEAVKLKHKTEHDCMKKLLQLTHHEKHICETSDILESQDQTHQEADKLIPKDEPEWLKTLLQSIHPEKHLGGPSDRIESQDQAHQEAVKLIPKDEPDWLKKLLQSTNHEKNLCKPSDIAAIDRAVVQPTTSVAVAFVQPTTNVDVSVSNLNKLDRSPEIREVEGPAKSSNRLEELKLLKEIKEKLNALQDEIAIQKVKISPARDEPSLQPLAEVLIITSFL